MPVVVASIGIGRPRYSSDKPNQTACGKSLSPGMELDMAGQVCPRVPIVDEDGTSRRKDPKPNTGVSTSSALRSATASELLEAWATLNRLDPPVRRGGSLTARSALVTDAVS